jgi:hypothetical protein
MDTIDRFKLEALGNMKQTVNTLSGEVEKSRGYIARAEGVEQNRIGGGTRARQSAERAGSWLSFALDRRCDRPVDELSAGSTGTTPQSRRVGGGPAGAASRGSASGSPILDRLGCC